FAAVGVAFLMGMQTSGKAVITSQKHVTVESLAKSQMEHIKGQEYDDVGVPPQYEILLSGIDGYDVTATAERLDPLGDGTDNDDGLQKIIVVVSRDGEEAFRLEDYKVNR
ncbi:MAG: hypothetical protein ACFFH0_11950, partial [Promethearchaeota archaeon]